MADSLLSHRINSLLLNARAPFPSEVKDGHELVKHWRLEQRLRLVAGLDATDRDLHPASGVSDNDLEES